MDTVMHRDGATALVADATAATKRAAKGNEKGRAEQLSGISKSENQLLEHKRKACEVYTKLSAEARPILMDNSMTLDGEVVDFLGSEALTRTVESRRQHRVGVADTPERGGDDAHMVEYSICTGTVANVKCKESTPTEAVYVADREGRYGTTRFVKTASRIVDVDTKAIPGISNLFEARYVSVISHQVASTAVRSYISTIFNGRTSFTDVDSSMAETVIDLLQNMASSSSKIVYDKPAYTLPPYNTADYSIHVLSLSGSVKNLPGHVLNIHRTLVVAERTLAPHGGSKHVFPLCEEVVVDFVPKDAVDTIRKHTLTSKSLVLTAAVHVGERSSETRKPLSILHYFGSNACTALFGNISHANRENRYASTHANGMYVAGWMVRQLANISSEIGIQNTDVSAFSKFLRSDHPARTNKKQADTQKQILRHTFLGRQKAQNLLTTDGRKMFYTKVWKATPTICVICISPLSDLSTNSVFVWSIGSGYDGASSRLTQAPSQVARPRSVSRGRRRLDDFERDGFAENDAPPTNARTFSDVTDYRGGLARNTRGDAFASMLSPELELELELL